MMRKYTLSDEARRARSELMKRLSKDPDFAAKRNAASRNRMKKLNAKAEFKAASSERLKKLHADTKFQKKIKAKVTNAEFRPAASIRMKNRLADPKYKKKHAEVARENIKRAQAARRRMATPS